MPRRASRSILLALVSGCAATPQSSGLSVPARFTALGTEPFWAAKVDGAQLAYTTPEDQSGTAIAVTRHASPSSVEIGGTLAGRRLQLTLSAGPCNDGMSDTVYPLRVVRRWGGDVERGCARAD